jgi:hypothetical protein
MPNGNNCATSHKCHSRDFTPLLDMPKRRSAIFLHNLPLRRLVNLINIYKHPKPGFIPYIVCVKRQEYVSRGVDRGEWPNSGGHSAVSARMEPESVAPPSYN